MSASPQPAEVASLQDVVSLAAVDSIFFARSFFPKTVRQESPPFHREVWKLLEEDNRLVNIQVFRGGGKTSLLRIHAAKRIAYGLAHTILYIGRSEGHAVRSVKWLRRQVEYNAGYAKTFGLRPGSKWQDSECEIIHGVDEYPIWIMATGITGSVRGILQDDFRPDLIILDDVIDDENAATPEQREKTNSLIHGAVKESLAPASEAPDATMCMLQTPMNKEDASTIALQDPEWVSGVFGCFTKDTADLAIHQQESIWPQRWSNQVLRKEKEAALAMNRASIFLREKECKLISPETCAFREDWLLYYELEPERHEMHVVMTIDPVPPPSEIQIAKGMRKKDYECLAVVGRFKGDFYLLEYSANRGHEPNWTIAEFFSLAAKWKPRRVYVEAVGYQRTLSWLLREAMKHQGRYYAVEEWTDRRKKFDRIVDGLAGPVSNGHFYCKPEQRDFITQFIEYPDCAHDDILESVAVGVSVLNGFGIGASDDDVMWQLKEEERDIPELEYERGSP